MEEESFKLKEETNWLAFPGVVGFMVDRGLAVGGLMTVGFLSFAPPFGDNKLLPEDDGRVDNVTAT
eukprot:CAMPEP_0119026588 /NCGR_PEP_ID=MMETSP1176-20130426/35735_1 /TAXON_ID=265551 /ORGANISM="Synedropsis recta cf, Strain CCMP1620" /LENGTH=65 /DNA_ID=CAMNT_0006982333 /DNA_START=79 /DNA_END=273 /DNA_ORIENTATION=+